MYTSMLAVLTFVDVGRCGSRPLQSLMASRGGTFVIVSS